MSPHSPRNRHFQHVALAKFLQLFPLKTCGQQQGPRQAWWQTGPCTWSTQLARRMALITKGKNIDAPESTVLSTMFYQDQETLAHLLPLHPQTA